MDPSSDVAGGHAWAAALRRLVDEHEPRDPREVVSKRRVLDELERLPRPWDESADSVHVTASAIVVGSRGTVLHRHRVLRRWLQPGGHVDEGESAASAARREAHEETGLDVDHPPGGPLLLHVDVHEGARGHTHLDLRYLLLGGDAEPAPLPGESPDARWWSWEEALRVADAALVGALRTARWRWERHASAWSDHVGRRSRSNGRRGGA